MQKHFKHFYLFYLFLFLPNLVETCNFCMLVNYGELHEDFFSLAPYFNDVTVLWFLGITFLCELM